MQKEKQIVNKAIEAAFVVAFQEVDPKTQTGQDVLKHVRREWSKPRKR